MADILLAVGSHMFMTTAPSFERLQQCTRGDWTAQRRLARRPALQFLGPGEDEIEIEGKLYPEAFPGADVVAGLQAECTAGSVLPVIAMLANTNVGDDVGLWVIKEVNNEPSRFSQSGPRKVEFSVKMSAYGDDADGFLGGLL